MSLDPDRRRQLADRLRARKREIAEIATQDFLQRHPEWIERFGERAWIRGREDAEFHVEFLAGAVIAGAPEAFVDYARWTRDVLSSRGIAPMFLAENLDQVKELAAADLDPAERQLIDGIVGPAIAALDDPAAPAEVGAHGAHGAFATERSLYLQAVRNGQRRAALSVALETLRAGATVPEVYTGILQPVQYEVGRLWERNEITVANEHMATAITQYVMAQLYTRLEFPDTVRGRAIVTGVRGELHQVGANMVADVLEADGWSMRFLGTQLPHDGILDAIADHEPILIGISATVLFNLPAVSELIEAIRRRFGSEPRIILGGGAFRGRPELWREMGADGFGRDLHEATVIAAELTSHQPD